jgi:hypothetical protein
MPAFCPVKETSDPQKKSSEYQQGSRYRSTTLIEKSLSYEIKKEEVNMNEKIFPISPLGP